MSKKKLFDPIDYEIKYENDIYENVFDKEGNSFLAMREVSWNGSGYKLELRKWYKTDDEKDIPGKGFAFLTKEGPDNLAELLVSMGYGNTDVMKKLLDDRSEDSSEEDKDYIDITDFVKNL